MKWDWGRVDKFVPFLRELSGGATFFEAVWCNIERTPGKPDWSAPDRVVSAAQELGYDIYLKVRVGTCWATGGRGGRERGNKTASAMPADMKAYESFVRALVDRYSRRGVHTYGIENEVNAKNFWVDQPADFERLARSAASTIRGVDARARVFDAGISSTAYGVAIARRLLDMGQPKEALSAYQRYYDRRFDVRGRDFPRVESVGELERALGGEQAKRNLEFLAVTARLAHEGLLTGYQLHFYESWGNVPALLEYLRDLLPPALPVEAWETGMFRPGSPPDERTHAAETVKVVAGLLGGGVKRVIWLPLSYDPGGRRPSEIRFGLLDDIGTARQAGVAFKTLSAAAADGTRVRQVTGKRVAGIGFERPGGQSALVLWSDQKVSLPAPPVSGARVAIMGGQPLPWGREGLTVGPEPVLVNVAVDLDAAMRLLT